MLETGVPFFHLPPTSLIFQSLIYDNVSGGAGGGIYLGLMSAVNYNPGPLNLLITNNTIYGNTINLNTLIQDAYVDGSQVAFGGYVSQTGFFNDILIGGHAALRQEGQARYWKALRSALN